MGLIGEVLLDVAPARRLAASQAAAVAALCLAFGALLFLATERRRALAQANARLERRVAERTAALRASNTELRREAAEREEAQAALKRAQADLVQAGKLSALGADVGGHQPRVEPAVDGDPVICRKRGQFMARGKPERAAENLTRISQMARAHGADHPEPARLCATGKRAASAGGL